MRKIMQGLLFLLMITTLIIVITPGKSTNAATTEYYFTKENQTTYKGEKIFVFKDNVDYLDFKAGGNPIYAEVKEIIVAEGVTYFDWDFIIMGYFPNVVNVNISSTVLEINCNGYSYNKQVKLESIIVSKDNSNFAAVSNCLYNKEMTTLIQYPVGSTNTSYIIPDTVTRIYESAFVNAKNLQTITLGAKVAGGQLHSIGEQLSHIREFKVSSKNLSYRAIDGVLFNKKGDTLLLYPNGKGNSYKVPKGTVTIESNAFYLSNIEYIKLPSGLKTIKEAAFSYCFSLISISIPKSVTQMNISDFQYLKCLKSIYVESGNKLYASYEGIIYNTTKTKMILVPRAYEKTALKFPSTLSSLYLSHFNLEKVSEITIPKSLKKLGLYNENPNSFDKIILEAGNKNFVLYKGSLYNKDKTELMLFKKQSKAEFPSTLKNLNALYLRNSGITEMVIPAKTQLIVWQDSVYDIPTLKKLSVDKNSQYYSMQDEMLLSKDKTVLIDVPRDVQNLIIPDNVKSIDTSLSAGMSKLKSIFIPKSFTEFSFYFLLNAKMIEEIEVDKENNLFTSIDGIMYSKDCSKLICYPMNKPDKSYVMPDSVKSISNVQFIISNPNLESITLSKLLKKDEYSFQQSNSLQEINVSKDNAFYTSIDGVLYNKEMTELISYPYHKKNISFTIPDTVIIATGLCYKRTYWPTKSEFVINSFSNPYLETIIIGKSVETLFDTFEENPIWDFKNLKNFVVTENNPYFSVKDGILYNKDLSILYLYPQNSENMEVVIPSTLKEVREKALDAIVSNEYLKKIIVETENMCFSTNGLTLSNLLGNDKYCTLGGVVYHKATYHD